MGHVQASPSARQPLLGDFSNSLSLADYVREALTQSEIITLLVSFGCLIPDGVVYPGGRRLYQLGRSKEDTSQTIVTRNARVGIVLKGKQHVNFGLVGYATRYGSTQEVAEQLRRCCAKVV